MDTNVKTLTDSAVSPATAEVLTNLVGECGETLQAVSKLLQHGPFSYDPTLPAEQRETNRVALEREVGHILGVVEVLVGRGVLRADVLDLHRREKLERLPEWSHGRLAVRDGGLGSE